LSEALKYDWVKILVVLNGVTPEVHERISGWATDNTKIIIENKIENEPNPSVMFGEIRQKVKGWCNFISDDDIFNHEILNVIESTLSQNEKLIAVSTAVEVIDSLGNKTGETRSPNYDPSVSKASNLVSALHEPSFPWPSLFFNIDVLPENLPSSRYVFDWWVGIQLIMAGQVSIVEEPGVKYRVHEGQESSVASNRRKYFEALIWFMRLVKSMEFKNWLSELSNEDKQDFWRSLSLKKPIYGDSKFSLIMTFSIAEEMILLVDRDLKEEIMNKLALVSGVILKQSESQHVIPGFEQRTSLSNCRLQFKDGTCESVTSLGEYFSKQNDLPLIYVSCRHSHSKKSSYLVECLLIKDLEIRLRADFLSMQLANAMESDGVFDLTLTPVEIGLVKSYRIIKRIMPKRLHAVIRKYFRNQITSRD
jgi:hypothetical protein